MRVFRKNKPSVLVIGSAHMDVLGDFPISEKHRVDKEGEVFCSIGGSAFNIAVDIANEGGVLVSLFTHVRAKSPVTDIILSRLLEEGVSTKYVFRSADIQKDSGFIAHRADGELVSAVSCMPVEDAQFDERSLTSAISRASVVVAECNLSGTQLALTARVCNSIGRPLIIGGVSESKCQRVRLLTDTSFRIAFFSLNFKEAKALLGRQPTSANESDAVDLCSLSNADCVVVTDGAKGWTVYSSNGAIKNFEAPKVPAIRSTTGAGDALIASIAHYRATHEMVDWKELHSHVSRFVAEVLRKRVASGADLTSLETLGAAYKTRLLDNFKRPAVRIGTLAAGIVAVLSLVAGLIQAAVSLETSTRVLPGITSLYCYFVAESSICTHKEVDKVGK